MVKNDKGQATVELAFALVIFMVLLFAIVDFGRIFHAYLTLEHASREGARIASVGTADTDIRNRVKTTAGTLNTEQITIDITPTFESRSSGSYVTIQLSYPVTFSMPLINNTTERFTLRSKTVMRVE